MQKLLLLVLYSIIKIFVTITNCEKSLRIIIIDCFTTKIPSIIRLAHMIYSLRTKHYNFLMSTMISFILLQSSDSLWHKIKTNKVLKRHLLNVSHVEFTFLTLSYSTIYILVKKATFDQKSESDRTFMKAAANITKFV